MFRRGSFTIIELLIVIAVIGILVGLALPRFKGLQEEANIAKAKSELRVLQTAVESYYMHNNNTYPAAGATWQSVLVNSTPRIISSTLNDPFNTTAQYGYAVDSGTPVNYYVLYSLGMAGNGAATVDTNGTVSETNGASCIYTTNGITRDTQP
jgi:general secretion pathway protein G